MWYKVAFTALILVVTTANGQHGGGARGADGARGAISSHRGSEGRAVRPSGSRAVGRRGSGSGFLAPYFPIGGDYPEGLAGYDNYYPPPPDFLPVEPAPEPPRVAHAVVNEYKWKDEGVEVANSSPTFTIALRDGSLRYAVAAWLQNSQLYYVDSEGKQDALSSNQIDRGATQRLNGEKNLRLQLPPG
jgi:hypothetical protein